MADQVQQRPVKIPAETIELEGNLALQPSAQGIVIFVHGSGSSRHSPRNQFVARVLQESGLATLLFDLLTVEEEKVDLSTAYLRFDIELLADRTASIINWVSGQPETQGLKIGLFGASTGAAAALIAAASQPDLVNTVVSRGGRPDLAARLLHAVAAPTLLIVGERDEVVLDLNRQALAALKPGLEKRLDVIPGATHLFEEPGTLEQATERARGWFQRFLK